MGLKNSLAALMAAATNRRVEGPDLKQIEKCLMAALAEQRITLSPDWKKDFSMIAAAYKTHIVWKLFGISRSWTSPLAKDYVQVLKMLKKGMRLGNRWRSRQDLKISYQIVSFIRSEIEIAETIMRPIRTSSILDARTVACVLLHGKVEANVATSSDHLKQETVHQVIAEVLRDFERRLRLKLPNRLFSELGSVSSGAVRKRFDRGIRDPELTSAVGLLPGHVMQFLLAVEMLKDGRTRRTRFHGDGRKRR